MGKKGVDAIRRARDFVVVVFVLSVASAAVHADEIHWRYDYTAARRESQQTGKPMFLDFSTEWCAPCKKLERTTFRDPAVVQALNDRFIAVKLDGSKEKALAELLQVQVYPTLILAGADGRILRNLEGYLEAPRLRDYLLEVATAAPTNPEWMQRACAEAKSAIAAGEFTRAVAQLGVVLQDGQNRPPQQEARKLLAEIEQSARVRIAEARGLEERGQFVAAVEELSKVVRAYAGAQAAADAAKALAALADKPEVKAQQRRQRAAELFTQAKSDYQNQQYLCCLDRCVVLVQSFSDLPEGAEGGRLLGQIKANPQWMKSAADQLSLRLGEIYLAMAESWLAKGETKLAAEYLERVTAMLPGTRYADTARARLAQIAGPAANTTSHRK